MRNGLVEAESARSEELADADRRPTQVAARSTERVPAREIPARGSHDLLDSYQLATGAM
jgi:hypothetical protein